MSLNPKNSRFGHSTIADGIRVRSSETAGPSSYATPDFPVQEIRVSPVGMTNLRAVANLGMSGGGWTE